MNSFLHFPFSTNHLQATLTLLISKATNFKSKQPVFFHALNLLISLFCKVVKKDLTTRLNFKSSLQFLIT